jgi:hypothetical protein
MHGIGLDMPLQDWFDFKIPRTQIPKNYIARILTQKEDTFPRATAKIVWLGPSPSKVKRALLFSLGREEVELEVPEKLGAWLLNTLPTLSLGTEKTGTYAEFQAAYSKASLGNFEHFWEGEIAEELREMGLLVV